MIALIGIIIAKVAVATQETMLAIATGLGLGFILGLINGLLVRKLSISPLIVTLAMLALYGGLAFVVSSVAVYGFPQALLDLGRGKLWGVQYTVIIAVTVFVVGSFILTRTVTGLRIYAIGGDPRAAELCGVPVARTIVGLYALNGLLIGLVAVLVAGRLGSITPTIGAWLRVGRLDRSNPWRRGLRWRSGPPARYRNRRGDHWHPQCRPHLHGPAVMVAVCRCWRHAASRSRRQIRLQSADARRAPAMPRHVHRPQQWFAVGASTQAWVARASDATHAYRPAFSVIGANKSYGAPTALEEASFTVGKGEMVCLLGDNGAGKSTLVKIISGAIKPDAGSMMLEGTAVIFRAPRRRGRRVWRPSIKISRSVRISAFRTT